MSLSRPELHELANDELLHVHHGCIVSARASLAMGDEDIDEFLTRAEAVMAELHNRLNPDQAVKVPEHRRKLKSGRPRKQR